MCIQEKYLANISRTENKSGIVKKREFCILKWRICKFLKFSHPVILMILDKWLLATNYTCRHLSFLSNNRKRISRTSIRSYFSYSLGTTLGTRWTKNEKHTFAGFLKNKRTINAIKIYNDMMLERSSAFSFSKSMQSKKKDRTTSKSRGLVWRCSYQSAEDIGSQESAYDDRGTWIWSNGSYFSCRRRR